jgi:hypothetical protein
VTGASSTSTVAGTWKYENGKVDATPYESLDRDTLREVREEANRLAAFHRESCDRLGDSPVLA